MSRTNSASGLSNLNIRAAAGVAAKTAPATKPAAGDATRLTAAYTSATDPMPINACGTRRLALENPKIRPDTPMTHNEAGGLSTVMKFEVSRDPKNHAFQFWEPACAAAA